MEEDDTEAVAEEAEELVSAEGVSDIRRSESISRARGGVSVREAAPI